MLNLKKDKKIEKGGFPSFDLFSKRLAARPYCTENLRDGLSIYPHEIALKKPYIQFNNPAFINALVLDIDHGWSSSTLWIDNALPAPNLIVKNTKNGNCHYIYIMAAPICTSNNAHYAPQKFFAAIQNVYTKILGADENYTGLITKTPFHWKWQTVEMCSKPYTLNQLMNEVDQEDWQKWTSHKKKNKKKTADIIGFGRNCALFEQTRKWAYKHLDKTQGFEQWHDAVLSVVEKYNDFSTPLSFSELKATAKSIAKWVWNNYKPSKRGDSQNRGAMKFGQTRHNYNFNVKKLTSEERIRRQSLSAQRTINIKKDQTIEKIINAIALISSADQKMTKAAITKISALSRSTIYRYNLYQLMTE